MFLNASHHQSVQSCLGEPPTGLQSGSGGEHTGPNGACNTPGEDLHYLIGLVHNEVLIDRRLYSAFVQTRIFL